MPDTPLSILLDEILQFLARRLSAGDYQQIVDMLEKFCLTVDEWQSQKQ